MYSSLLQEGIGTTIFSGLYRYNTIDKNWTCLKPDYTGGTYPHNPVPRMAHVMLLHVVSHVTGCHVICLIYQVIR